MEEVSGMEELTAKTSVYLNVHRRAFLQMNGMTAQQVLDIGFEEAERRNRMGPTAGTAAAAAAYNVWRTRLPAWHELSEREQAHWANVVSDRCGSNRTA